MRDTNQTLEADVNHLLILADAFFDHLQRGFCEYGAWGQDDKRPFGNSDVEGDILELLGLKPEGDDGEDECWSSKQRAYASRLYEALGPFLRRTWRELRTVR